MLPFRPFNSKIRRQKKYFSQKKNVRQQQRSIFQLPNQVFTQQQLKSYKNMNPQNQRIPIIKMERNSSKHFAMDYQDNLRRTAFSHSKQLLKNKLQRKELNPSQTLQDTIYNSFIQNKRSLSRNKSTNNSINKTMAFKTLNILYRTIIQTKFVKRPKQSFQLNASHLPMLQRRKPKPKQQKQKDLAKFSELLVISPNRSKENFKQFKQNGEIKPWGGKLEQQWYY